MLVQVIPSIYEKQMEISDKNLHELLRGQKTGQQPRNRVFSENKQMNPRKRLSKIEESVHSNKKKNMRESLYLKSPHNHNDPHHECSTCARRLENFRLKQVKKQKQDRSFHKT
jgi:ABC-type nickel/cobalt efflux system permease component RcnA